MSIVHRITVPHAVADLDDYRRRRGGGGWEAARGMAPDDIIATIEAAGLRGRGGGGFPTALKWRTVRDMGSPDLPTTMVVNIAEGEPGTFKDRSIVRSNPYQVLEGALIGARAVGAAEIVFGMKAADAEGLARVRTAIGEVIAAGWVDGVTLEVFEGPDEYLYGEETAMLEAMEGRAPFPRIAPPWRRGLIEVVEQDGDVGTGSGLAAHVEMADPDHETGAPPTLVDNTETLANVAHILARGAEWFRTEGTDASPGTLVCTFSGAVERPGVGEVLMGTTLRAAMDAVADGPESGTTVKAVLSGVSNRVTTADQLDTPLTYEDMQPLGIGPGSAGFIVFDESADMLAVAAGVSRFLAVESCGQCTPCKKDGIDVSERLDRLCANRADQRDLDTIRDRLATITDGARCFLATQHQTVVGSILDAFADEVDAHLHGRTAPVERILVAEARDLTDAGLAVDATFSTKQPDWTHGPRWGGETPWERDVDHRRHERVDE